MFGWSLGLLEQLELEKEHVGRAQNPIFRGCFAIIFLHSSKQEDETLPSSCFQRRLPCVPSASRSKVKGKPFRLVLWRQVLHHRRRRLRADANGSQLVTGAVGTLARLKLFPRPGQVQVGQVGLPEIEKVNKRWSSHVITWAAHLSCRGRQSAATFPLLLI